MIKSSKKIIIAAAAVVLLAVGIVVVVNMDTTEQTVDTEGSEPVYTIFPEGAEDIAEVEVRAGEDVIRAVNNGEWTINDLTADEVDTNKAYGLAGTISMLTSKNKIEDNPSDLGQYGLDNPDIIVTVRLKDGTERKLSVGDKSPTLGEYFIMKDGDNAVYTMYEFKVETLKQPLSYYKDFDRFNVNIDDITDIKFVRSDETVEIKLLDDIDENTNNVWEMVSPYESGANDDYIDNKILVPIDELSLNVPSETVTASDFPSEASSVTITVRPYDNTTGKYGDEYTETFRVWNNGDKSYVEYKDHVYETQPENVSFVNESSFNIVSKLQALVDISKVKGVTVEYGGEKHTIGIEHENNGTMTFTLDGNETDDSLSQQMYKGIAGLAADSVYNGESSGETVMKLSYEGIKDSDDIVVEFKKIDDLNCSVVRGGKTEFTIKTSKIDEFKEVFDEYVKNPTAEVKE